MFFFAVFGVQNNLSPSSPTLTQNATAASAGQQQFKLRKSVRVTNVCYLLSPFL